VGIRACVDFLSFFIYIDISFSDNISNLCLLLHYFIGCYATGAQLALLPLLPWIYQEGGRKYAPSFQLCPNSTATVFGVSGYSGAGACALIYFTEKLFLERIFQI
jgi:hypothetical protein